MTSELNAILQELRIIRRELEEIKEEMLDRDMFLTTEEIILLNNSYENEKAGKLVSSQELKQELGI